MCFTCKQSGHIAANCPSSPNTIDFAPIEQNFFMISMVSTSNTLTFTTLPPTKKHSPSHASCTTTANTTSTLIVPPPTLTESTVARVDIPNQTTSTTLPPLNTSTIEIPTTISAVAKRSISEVSSPSSDKDLLRYL
ncbi:unnamed protein product [Psylliodes chrysocephalus]|uniref:CCHC-type domain-containing protein n=1 Tax=Psylliodes chrysocephalus TaxID=3402493 RepID=A0A9P0DBW4_9CUCU|nr:unnamed protein product [Psylliodes chrysocephala]